jgi:hypothetical protein
MRIMVGVLLLLAFMSTAGCNQWRYVETPECEYASPPEPKRYLKGNVDERLVMMTQAYTGQVRKTTECNSNIEKVNAKNTALFR